jgi:hypothetical protein
VLVGMIITSHAAVPGLYISTEFTPITAKSNFLAKGLDYNLLFKERLIQVLIQLAR